MHWLNRKTEELGSKPDSKEVPENQPNKEEPKKEEDLMEKPASEEKKKDEAATHDFVANEGLDMSSLEMEGPPSLISGTITL